MTLSGTLKLVLRNRETVGLNPSFSGWPSPGLNCVFSALQIFVLIPLLVDDPLRADFVSITLYGQTVLIPLLVDDPLREVPFFRKIF